MKTTIAGILVLVSALAVIVSNLIQGHAVDWPTVGAQVAAGIGLLHAGDAPKSDPVNEKVE